MPRERNVHRGKNLRTFLRGLLADEAGVDAALADRLAARCAKQIDEVRIRDTGPQKVRRPNGKAHVNGAKPASVPPFDPYAFSAVVVLSKMGHEALLARLGTIRSAKNLRLLAEAQHIAIDPELTRLAELRLAIVRGAEQRIADRRAAAS